jgi:hypothetical protein
VNHHFKVQPGQALTAALALVEANPRYTF